MKYISWNKITKVSLTGLLICGATLCENAQAEENYTYSGVTENLINTTVDVDPPEFVSLTSDKTEVRSGERVNYTLKAHDKGKLTTATIVLKNDENGKIKALYADSPTSDGTFSFTLEVDEKLSSGIWRINGITLRDDSDNYVDIDGEDALALYSTPLKVENNVTVDVTPPEFVSLASDKTEVRSGERVNYTLKAKDNGKLTTATIVLKNDENGKIKALYADSPTSDGTFSFTLEVDEKLSSGIWRINGITLRDDSDNYVDIDGEDALALYSKPLKVGESSLNNVANNLQPDTEAPKLISIKLNQASATEHDVVTYTVDASDNRQLDSAYLTIRSVSSPSKYEILTGKLNKEGQFIFRYQVDENTFPGDWQISSLSIYDKAKNISEYDSENIPKESSPILTISSNLQPDTEAPKLISIKLNQASATEHDVVTYTVDASDNRQLDSAYLTIRSVSSPSKYEILTGKLNKEGQFIFRYQVDENSFPGDWEISRLAIYDKAKNISEYNSENLPKESSPILTISTNLQPDTEAPKLISIKLNQISATEHDVVTYTVDASDNRQLDSAYLTIRSVSSPSKYEILTGKLNKEGQFIFRYQVDENSFPGDWEISRLAIYDKAKNISEYNSENLPKESSPILRVANRREISSLDSINSEKESKNDANILPTDSLSNNQPIDESVISAQSTDKTSNENINTAQSTDKTDSENSTSAQSTDKTDNENINTAQSTDKTDSENSTSAQSTDKTDNENINTAQSTDKTDSENSTSVQSTDKTDSENSTSVQSTNKTSNENSTSVQSTDKTSNENINTVQSTDKTDSENLTSVQSTDKTDSENSTSVQSTDKTSNENINTVQSTDKNNSESINMDLYVQDALQNNGFSPYGEGNLFENANSDMIEKNNELKIHQYPKRIERNLPKTGNKLFSVLSILGAINLLLILLRILMKTL
ncbi:hypothetical protein FJR77_08695 [Streptococcus shenyangsis]|uniref:LPXTG cell wall anchor domain-containing protein n=2 Tax=Streptococcus TaxID=1301 RepID=A0ABY2YDR4_9STRE|nr:MULTISPECIES: hypothetical protein [Streptococcus]TPE37342.1 hypothetical protein FJR73_08415 [Streptococcus sp. D2]TPE37397.1 hypothetical protein FJR77_08695 [Streptococcus shenyangsis]